MSYLENAIDAQHGEFPSRLLDVSYNCLTALYFAVTPYYHHLPDSLDNVDGMVYIFYVDEIFSPSASNTNDNYNTIINKDVIVAVTRKAVKLPNYDYIKGFLRAVTNHTLKLGAVVRFSRNGSVYVMPNDNNAVFLGKSSILSNLPLDRFLTLIIRGITSVYYTCHTPSTCFLISMGVKPQFAHFLVLFESSLIIWKTANKSLELLKLTLYFSSISIDS